MAGPTDRTYFVTILRNHLLSLLIAAGMVACGGGDPIGPSGPSLAVTVTGLPSGTPAQVSVTGPGGYSQSVSGTQTLTPLTAGSYTVTASSVTVGSTSYSGNPASQTVVVSGSAGALVTYSTAGPSLQVNINGLGTSGTAAVTVTGPGGYSQDVTASRTLTGLTAGVYAVTAQDVTASCGTLYTASPASQNSTVTSGSTASATVSYSAQTSGGLPNVCIDGLYLTQSTQTYTGTVPLVQNRNGYLRVFVVANQSNVMAPAVQVRLYNGAAPLWQTTIAAPGPLVPTLADESSLSKSWNVAIPGTMIQQGLRIEAEVDPTPGIVTESNETDNVFPAAGPQAMNVRAVPTLNVTLVPIRQGATGPLGNVSNPDAFLETIRAMHPIDAVNVQVRTPYTTTATLQADGTGWTTVLDELDAARVASPQSSRYWYGVAKVPYSVGVAGVAFVSDAQSGPQRTGLGWDYLPSGSEVAAHELGHNWGRTHAPSPCVATPPGSLDAQYPHSNGSVGVFGFDVSTGSLKDATLGDVMGYCDPTWIGDYTYKAVLNYLSPASPMVASFAASQAVQPCLLIWGHIRNGEMVLEPAFQVNTRPSLPARAGPYSVSARAEDGTTLFSLSFAPKEIADLPGGQKNFVFAVPLSDARARQLATLRLSGRGRQMVRRAQPAAVSGAQPSTGVKPLMTTVRRSSGGGVGVRWDARDHPMVMVRDAQSGEVLSFARGGSVEIPGSRREVDLVLSDGVKSSVRRVPVTP